MSLLGDALLDVPDDLVAVLRGDQGSHFGALLQARGHLDLAQTLDHFRHQRIGRIADRDENRDRHAAFTGGAVSGRDGSIGSEIHVGVGEHDHVVLGAAKSGHALSCLGAGLIDVASDGRRTDERHGGDVRMGEDPIDCHLVAVDDIQHPIGESRLHEEFRTEVGRRGILLGRLEHEGVSAGDGDRVHPHGHHRRKVERGDARHDADGLADRIGVDRARHVLVVLTLDQLRDTAGKLDHLEAALHLALGVAEHLAVLRNEKSGDVVLVLLDEVAEGEEDRSAAGKRDVLPCVPSAARRGNGGIDVIGGGHGNTTLNETGCGVVDVTQRASSRRTPCCRSSE